MSLSACVTRILSLRGFDPTLKTRDIQTAFAEFENERGGFKIKWIDDTSLLIVFADPAIAKRAYLQTLLNPPPQFTSPTSDKTAILRPYDGVDAQNVIAAVNSRATGHRTRASMSAASGVPASTSQQQQQQQPGHVRRDSRGWKKAGSGNINLDMATASISSSAMPLPVSPLAREPSPTLPSLPSHPTLGSLISSTLPEISAHDTAVAS